MSTQHVSDKDLQVMIVSLQEYADSGVTDPWLLSDGRTVEPLETLKDLRNCRAALDMAERALRGLLTYMGADDEDATRQAATAKAGMDALDAIAEVRKAR